MKRPIRVLAVFLASYGLIGCRQQASDSAVESANGNNPPDAIVETDLSTFARQDLHDRQLPTGLTQETPPDQIVAAFLGALRSGDSGVAEALLTRRAYEETRKRDLAVRSLGSPAATFKIGIPEYLGAHKNGAHVNTTWTETQNGAVSSYDIIWALRRQDSGWRVAGMGAQLGPGEQVVYLNFEDPDDMLAKWRQADDAVIAGQTPDSGIRQAQDPQVTGALQR
ncbi:MAG TPA: hypothetical protein QF564_24030 [Pirellulaceae bacterium]|nr:hypothetical protein [Pirellulaceae bacterium]